MVAALAIIAILSLAYNAILWSDARSKSAQMRMALQQLEEQKIILEKEREKEVEAEERIRHLVNHDNLTGLSNRLLLGDFFHLAAASARRNRTLLGLLYLDLDDFKPVNEELGRKTGDEVLCDVAMRLQASVRESDIVARLGGDEFAIVLPNLSRRDDASQVAKKVLQKLASLYTIKGKDWAIGVSIGISIYPTDGDNLEQLLNRADEAMSKVKSSGKNGFAFWTPKPISGETAASSEVV